MFVAQAQTWELLWFALRQRRSRDPLLALLHSLGTTALKALRCSG